MTSESRPLTVVPLLAAAAVKMLLSLANYARRLFCLHSQIIVNPVSCISCCLQDCVSYHFYFECPPRCICGSRCS